MLLSHSSLYVLPFFSMQSEGFFDDDNIVFHNTAQLIVKRELISKCLVEGENATFSYILINNGNRYLVKHEI